MRAPSSSSQPTTSILFDMINKSYLYWTDCWSRLSNLNVIMKKKEESHRLTCYVLPRHKLKNERQVICMCVYTYNIVYIYILYYTVVILLHQYHSIPTFFVETFRSSASFWKEPVTLARPCLSYRPPSMYCRKPGRGPVDESEPC